MPEIIMIWGALAGLDRIEKRIIDFSLPTPSRLLLLYLFMSTTIIIITFSQLDLSMHCDATDVYTFSHYDISFPTMVGLFLLSHKHIIISENIFFITRAVGDIAAGLMALLLPVVMLK